MSKISHPVRTLVALGLTALAVSATSSDAFARGFGGSHGGRSMGGSGHIASMGRSPSGGGHYGHAPSSGGHYGRYPGHTVGMGRPMSPHFYRPRGPHYPPIVIGHYPHPYPHPHWPVIVDHYPQRGPIIPVGGSFVVPTTGAVSIANRVDAAPVRGAVGPTCDIPAGSYVSVVFLPTATVADVTAFLKAYNVTMADGPNVDGVYRIRLSDRPLPANSIVEFVTSMRSQVAIVSQVRG